MARAKKPCSVPGCPKITDRGKCPDCKTSSAAPRLSSRQRGYDSRWERTRREFIAENPICCEIGCWLPTTDVDHIDGLGPLGPEGHKWSNLRPYCHSHHSRRTARDQPGGWHSPSYSPL